MLIEISQSFPELDIRQLTKGFNMRDRSKPYTAERPTRKQRDVTAIQYAVYNRRHDLVKLLLSHGATDWRAGFHGADEYVFGSILDVIVELGARNERTTHPANINKTTSIDREILKTLLQFRLHTVCTPRERPVRALHLAVLRNRPNYVAILFEYCPGLQHDANMSPWLLSEAASLTKGTTMFRLLANEKVDMNATNEHGHGSALASAASCSNIELIRHLLATGVDVNGTAHGLGSSEDSEKVTISEKALQNLHGLTALHISVRNNDEELTRLILACGANTNKNCRVHPIQMAA